MAGIGNYVHYTARGYLDYGTNPPGGKRQRYDRIGAENAQLTFLLNELESYSSGISEQDKQDIKKCIEAILSSTESNDYTQEIQQEVEKKLEAEFGNALQQIRWDTGNIAEMTPMPTSLRVSKVKTLNLKNMLNKVEELEKSLIQQANTNFAGKQGILVSDILPLVKQIKVEYQELYNNIVQDAQTHGWDIDKIQYHRKGGSNWSYNEILGMRNVLNEIIQKYAGYPALNLQKGELFEYLLEALPIMAKNVGIFTATDYIMSNAQKIGGVTSPIQLNRAYFDSNIVEKLSNGTFSAKTSQGKVDVTMDWKGKHLRISAKNMHGRNWWIHLVDSANLLAMLQETTGTDYVNHFLNIFADHPTTLISDTGKPSSDVRNVGIVKSMRGDFAPGLKASIIYYALTGNYAGRQNANIFIVNMKGSIHVMEMVDVYKWFLQNQAGTASIRGFNINKDSFENPYDINPYDRIGKVVQQAANVRINVSISSSAVLH